MSVFLAALSCQADEMNYCRLGQKRNSLFDDVHCLSDIGVCDK